MRSKMVSSRFVGVFAVLLLFLAASVTSQPVMDDYLLKKAAEVREKAIKVFEGTDVDEALDNINGHVHQACADHKNHTSERRHLKGRKGQGPCMATNPVDRCWRCDPQWHRHRKRLAKCALGFGRKTIGGKLGRIYVVTDDSDPDLVNPKQGTLRWGVTRNEPLWIIFARDMIIRLSEELIVASFKTIDGRGANVHITGGSGITVQYAIHVIIHNIHIHNIHPGSGGVIRDTESHFGNRLPSDGDAINVYASMHVWIDHCSMYRASDGLIDVVMGSTAVTISNNHFTHHDHVMLFGHANNHSDDKIMQITVAFNHFGKGLIQRMPRCRFGFFHVLNNDYTHWEMYAIGGSQNPTIISQGNRYIANPNIKSDHNSTEITKRESTPESEWKNWIWRSQQDKMFKGAYFRSSGPQKGKLGFSRAQVIKAKSGSYVGRLTRYAGTLNCKKNKPC